MEEFCNKIRIYYPQEEIEFYLVDRWPAPKEKKRQYCLHKDRRLENTPERKEMYLRALHVAQGRVDITCLNIPLLDLLDHDINVKLEGLLNNHDRSWDVILTDDTEKRVNLIELRRALVVLRNIQSLKFPLQRLDALTVSSENCDVRLHAAPQFKKLHCLDLCAYQSGKWGDIQLVTYPFAAKLHGVWLGPGGKSLDRYCFPDLESSRTAPKDPANTCDLTPSPTSTFVDLKSFDADSATDVVSFLFSLKSLTHLGVNLPDSSQPSNLVPLTMLFSWLESPQCPVMHLKLQGVDSEYLPMVVAVIPKIPRLKTIWIETGGRSLEQPDARLFMTAFWNCSHLEFVTFECPVGTRACRRILNEQLSNTDRMLPVQLLTGSQKGNFRVQKIIHFTSHAFQTLRNLRRSKYKPTFPLSAWALILDKLSIVRDSTCTPLRPLGIEVTFLGIRDLLDFHNLDTWRQENSRDHSQQQDADDSASSTRQDSLQSDPEENKHGLWLTSPECTETTSDSDEREDRSENNCCCCS